MKELSTNPSVLSLKIIGYFFIKDTSNIYINIYDQISNNPEKTFSVGSANVLSLNVL